MADVARPRSDDPRVYDSAIWLMQTGAWQIRVTADGARGAGVMGVPIPALERAVRPMSGFLALLLFALMALLVAGAIACAAVRAVKVVSGDRGWCPGGGRLSSTVPPR